jgi:uncharacterized damage-inducible protein DinB
LPGGRDAAGRGRGEGPRRRGGDRREGRDHLGPALAPRPDERGSPARAGDGLLTGAAGLLLGLARNNRWSNHRLLTACARLRPDELTAYRTGFFPSLIATLNHILIVDRFYIDGLEGGRLGPAAWADPIPRPTIAALAAEQASWDQRLIALCERWGDAELAAACRLDRGGQDQVERRDRVLLHLFQHQIHHRGQAHAMLAGTSVAPPQLDEYFLAADAASRAREMAELGLAEPALR